MFPHTVKKSAAPEDILAQFLGRVRKNCEKRLSSVMSVCPSVRMDKLSSHWTDFREI